MALEDTMERLIAALDANTAAMKARLAAGAEGETTDETAPKPETRGRKARGAAAEPAAPPAPPAEPEPDPITKEQVIEIGMKMLQVVGKDAAKKLVKEHGSDKLAEMDPKHYAAFYAAATAAIDAVGDEDI